MTSNGSWYAEDSAFPAHFRFVLFIEDFLSPLFEHDFQIRRILEQVALLCAPEFHLSHLLSRTSIRCISVTDPNSPAAGSGRRRSSKAERQRERAAASPPGARGPSSANQKTIRVDGPGDAVQWTCPSCQHPRDPILRMIPGKAEGRSSRRWCFRSSQCLAFLRSSPSTRQCPWVFLKGLSGLLLRRNTSPYCSFRQMSHQSVILQILRFAFWSTCKYCIQSCGRCQASADRPAEHESDCAISLSDEIPAGCSPCRRVATSGSDSITITAATLSYGISNIRATFTFHIVNMQWQRELWRFYRSVRGSPGGWRRGRSARFAGVTSVGGL